MNGDTLALGVVAAVAVASLCVKRPSGSRTVAPAGSLALDELARRRMPRADFVFPQDRSFPIHDHTHGQKALIYAMTPSNEMRRYRVMRDVFGRYPDLQAWWNTTEKGRLDPANRNSWQTTLLKYRALLQRTTDAAEVADLRGEIAALTDLVSTGARRAA